MTQYRKKPVVINAVQWTGENESQIMHFIGGSTQPLGDGKLGIPTLEGDMIASMGDYIIKGVKGEFYPCKPDIFEMTYDAIQERFSVGEKAIIKGEKHGHQFTIGSEVEILSVSDVNYRAKDKHGEQWLVVDEELTRAPNN